MVKRQDRKSLEEIMEEVVDLAFKGEFSKANEVYGQDITKSKEAQQAFMQELLHSKFNDNTFHFVRQFTEPDWFSYIRPMTSFNICHFVSLVQKHGIDLYQKNNQGKVLLEVVLDKDHGDGRLKMLNEINTDNFRKAFIQGDISPALEHILESHLLHDQYTKNKNSVVDAILNKLNHPAVLASENYQKLFTQRNPFIQQLLSDNSIANVNTIIARHPQLLQEQEDMLLSTALTKRLMAGNEFKQEHADAIKAMVEQNRFKPNVEILPGDYAKVWKNGQISDLNIDSHQYNTYKMLVQNQLVDKEPLNNPQGRNYTFFEGVILDNLRSRYLDENFTNKVSKLIDEVKNLMDLGIEAKCCQHTRDGMAQLMEAQLSRKTFGGKEIAPEVEKLCRKIHLPPDAVQELVNFFDERYNFQPKVDLVAQQKKEELLQKWNDFVGLMVFPQEAKEERVDKKPRP